MKLLIAGSRNITDFDLTEHIPQETTLIICGGAKGIDQIAEQYADQHRISKLVLRPEYARYGRSAPLKRNETMVNMADHILIVWDGCSRGTKYTAEYARKAGKSLTVISLKEENRSTAYRSTSN